MENQKRLISDKFVFVEKDMDKMKYDFYILKNPILDEELGVNIGEKDFVARVTKYDAMRYCNRLNREMGLPITYDENSWVLIDKLGNQAENISDVKGFRLPTPMEWSYTAEGGKTKAGEYYNVQIILDKYFSEYLYCIDKMKRPDRYKTGEFSGNRLGVEDIMGNVSELCCEINKGKTENIVCSWSIYYTNYDCIPTYYVKGEKYSEEEKVSFRIVYTE